MLDGLLGGARLLESFDLILLIDGLLEMKIATSVDGDLDLDDSDVDGDGDFSILVEICDSCWLNFDI